jgi:hypothetical protein
MLKMMGKGKRNGKPVTLVAFGFSHRNLDLLRAGKPISFSGAACGLSDDLEFFIFADEDERVIQRKMHHLIGPEAVVKIDPKLKD